MNPARRIAQAVQDDLIAQALEIAERAERQARFFSHRTSTPNGTQICKTGLVPSKAPFAELADTGPFSMFVGCDSARPGEVDYVGGHRLDVVLVFSKHPSIRSIYRAFVDAGTVNQRVLGLAHRLENWFVSYERIPASYVERVLMVENLGDTSED